VTGASGDSADRHAAVAESLWQAWTTGQYDGPAQAFDVDTGQRIQVSLMARHAAAGRATGGFKIGLTSGAARDRFGAGVRPFGFLLAARMLGTGSHLARRTVPGGGLETELVFRVARDIRTRDATPAMARSVIDAVAPGFEINQRRVSQDAGGGMVVADNLSQWGIVVGAFHDLDSLQDAPLDRLVVSCVKDGETLQQVGAQGHIDDHFVSIARLINGLDAFGLGLRAGMNVITGSFTRVPIASSGHYEGDFGLPSRVSLWVEDEP